MEIDLGSAAEKVLIQSIIVCKEFSTAKGIAITSLSESEQQTIKCN